MKYCIILFPHWLLFMICQLDYFIDFSICQKHEAEERLSPRVLGELIQTILLGDA